MSSCTRPTRNNPGQRSRLCPNKMRASRPGTPISEIGACRPSRRTLVHAVRAVTLARRARACCRPIQRSLAETTRPRCTVPASTSPMVVHLTATSPIARAQVSTSGRSADIDPCCACMHGSRTFGIVRLWLHARVFVTLASGASDAMCKCRDVVLGPAVVKLPNSLYLSPRLI